MQKLSAPPGFVSRTSFVLKKIEGDGKDCTSAACSSTEVEPTSMDVLSHMINDSPRRRLLGSSPWMLYNEYEEDKRESDSEQQDSFSSHTSLPIGVIRGRQDCGDCQKVTTARWHPEDACSTGLQDAPVFHPTEEEFADMPVYIASIWKNVESYGICRIVPPSSWKPPCLDLGKKPKFTTQIQHINELLLDHNHKGTYRGKRKRPLKSGEVEYESGVIGSETAQEMDLETFKKYADGFKFEHFHEKYEIKSSNVTSATSFKKSEPSVENIEGEYWRIAEDTTEEIEIFRGADLDPRDLGSDTQFNRLMSTNDHKSLRSSWNLKVINQLSDSLLSYETCKNLSISMPRLHLGMCFSSSCWQVGEHHLYSLWYMHTGSPRIWYGVPGRCSFRFQAAVKKYYPTMVVEQPEMLYKLTRQLSPSALKSEGIPVYRCVHSPEEFVLVLPGAYHSGFDCGFNCVEGTKFAPLDWLPHGQFAVEIYSENKIKTSFAHDKLLLEAANEAVKAQWEILLMKKNSPNNLRWKSNCHKDGILAKALKSRIKWLESKMKYLCNPEQVRLMEKNFDARIKRECTICCYDLHLSAAGCSCSPDVYTCLLHSKKLCGCPWVSRFFLFRYEIGKLKILVDALEGKLSAVMVWAKEVLGFSLISNRASLVAASASNKSSLKFESQSLAALSGIQSVSEDVKPKAGAPRVTLSEEFEKNKPTGYLGRLGGASLSSSPLGDSLSEGSSTSSSEINLSEMFPISNAKASSPGFETEVTSAETPGNKRKRTDCSQLSPKQPMQKCIPAGQETVIVLSDDEG